MKMHAGWQFPDDDEHMWREMRVGGLYQSEHCDKALSFVADRSVAIDGGAHVGLWSAIMAKRFDSVIAVEPAADSFECLTTNMMARRLDNVVLCNAALGCEDKLVSMELDAKQTSRKNTGGRYVRDGGTIRVEMIDSWKLPTLGFLKLDVEGSEPAAIQGASETIARCKPVVLWEDKSFCTRYGYDKNAPRRLLAALGYEHKARVSADEIWGPRA
jgi:FkbM family methyltransferase